MAPTCKKLIIMHMLRIRISIRVKGYFGICWQTVYIHVCTYMYMFSSCMTRWAHSAHPIIQCMYKCLKCALPAGNTCIGTLTFDMSLNRFSFKNSLLSESVALISGHGGNTTPTYGTTDACVHNTPHTERMLL